MKLRKPKADNGRVKTVWVEGGECDGCEDSPCTVLTTDSSEGEYGPVRLCMPCVERAFDEGDWNYQAVVAAGR